MLPSTTRSNQVAFGDGGLRTKCAQIIGVSVSDTTIEIAMAKVSVTENSRNTRPITPVMNSSGMKAAISEMLIDTTVKPIWRAPSIAACTGVMPFSRLRKQFSIITIASSTTKPTDTTSAISDRLLIENPATHISAQVPASASGTVTPAAMVAAVRRRNTNTTIITSAMAIASVSCRSNTLARMVWVRSDRISMSTPAGIQRLISGSISRTRSTVSITLASADLVSTRRIEGWPLYQPNERLLRTPGSIEAIADSRTTVPLVARITSGSYCDAARIWSLVAMVTERSPPSKPPIGPVALALATAVRTSSIDRPIDASATGLTRMRIAGCSAPLTETSATPSTCDSRCATTVSAASYITLGCTVCEVIARIMIGVADGLDLRNDGRDGRSLGRSVSAALIAACTSRAAPSMSRLRSNCTVMRVSPSDERDVISVTPGISPSRRSSGAATVCAMVSGSAPGRLALTLMVGKSTVGMLATGRK